jgi:hypothetical protein
MINILIVKNVKFISVIRTRLNTKYVIFAEKSCRRNLKITLNGFIDLDTMPLGDSKIL